MLKVNQLQAIFDGPRVVVFDDEEGCRIVGIWWRDHTYAQWGVLYWVRIGGDLYGFQPSDVLVLP